MKKTPPPQEKQAEQEQPVHEEATGTARTAEIRKGNLLEEVEEQEA